MNPGSNRNTVLQQMLQNLELESRLNLNSNTVPPSEASSSRTPNSSFAEESQPSRLGTPNSNSETWQKQPIAEVQQQGTNSELRASGADLPAGFRSASTSAALVNNAGLYSTESNQPQNLSFWDYGPFTQQVTANYLSQQTRQRLASSGSEPLYRQDNTRNIYFQKVLDEIEVVKRHSQQVSICDASNVYTQAQAQANLSGQSTSSSHEAAVPQTLTPETSRLRYTTDHHVEEIRETERRSYVQLPDSNSIYTNVTTAEATRAVKYTYCASQHNESTYSGGSSSSGGQIRPRSTAQFGNFYPFNESASQYYERKQLQAAKAKRITSALVNQCTTRTHHSRSIEFQRIVNEIKNAERYSSSQSPAHSFASDRSDLPQTPFHAQFSNSPPQQGLKPQSYSSRVQYSASREPEMNYASVAAGPSASVKHDEFQKLANEPKIKAEWPPPPPPPKQSKDYSLDVHFPPLITSPEMYQFYLESQRFGASGDALSRESEETSGQEAETSETNSSNEDEEPKETSEEPKPYPVHESEVRYQNRNLLDLGGYLSGGPLVTPAVIPSDVQSVIANCSQVSRMCGWNVPPHIVHKCPDPDCGFEEQEFLLR